MYREKKAFRATWEQKGHIELISGDMIFVLGIIHSVCYNNNKVGNKTTKAARTESGKTENLLI